MQVSYLSREPLIPNLPTGVEDTEGWAFHRARTCEATLSWEEYFDAKDEGVDLRGMAWTIRPSDDAYLADCCGFARFNGRWFIPTTATAVASGLDPATHPGEFIALDDAECMALECVVAHWRAQEVDQ